MHPRRRYNRPVTVVRKRTKKLADGAQLYRQDTLFSSIKEKNGAVNLAVRVVGVETDHLEVTPLADNGDLKAGTSFSARPRVSRLRRRSDPTGKPEKNQEEEYYKGDILDLQGILFDEDGSASYQAAELMATVEELEDGEMEVLDNTLASIRTPVALDEGVRPEVFILRRDEAISILKVTAGLGDMVSMLKRDDGFGASGFLLRGDDPRGSRRYAAVCTLTIKQRKRGVTAEDVLGSFLREEVPSLSRMIRESGKKTPWKIIPVDICTTTGDFALKASQLARHIPFNREVDGENLWFAECSVAIKKSNGHREVSWLNPRNDAPMLVGKDYPEGRIEREITRTRLTPSPRSLLLEAAEDLFAQSVNTP